MRDALLLGLGAIIVGIIGTVALNRMGAAVPSGGGSLTPANLVNFTCQRYCS